LRRDRGRVDRGVFPPAQRAEVRALACELPAETGVWLSRWSSAELAREAVKRGIVARIAAVTIWRWLAEDAIRPWNYRSNLTLVHTPVHASWLNQAEIYFSITQRKVL
jgi:hypothetical protein